PARSFVRSVDPGSPAARAGIVAGDQIVAVAGESFTGWSALDDAFSRHREEPLVLEVQSPGEPPRRVEVALAEQTWKDIYDQTRTRLWLGLNPYTNYFQAEPEP